MMSESRTKLIPDRRDGKYREPPLVPNKNITSTTSLDNLEVCLSQESFVESCNVDAETKMLKTLDNCIKESTPLENVSYQIRPELGRGFKTMVVTNVIHDVLYEELRGKVYSVEEAKKWTMAISDSLRTKVKDLFERYKIMVQVVIGEHRGAGCVIGCRCCWDSDTDAFATNQFVNETIFCSAIVFGVYFY